ncbi:MAG: tetratricopeptide repeat protein [Verrucomicrobia bacterium]|nr:tetratricopeptide repeat protein [Verrucomicrobiota bacterium]
MKKVVLLLSLLGLSLSFSGCISNPINAYTASRYFESGRQQEAAGNMEAARVNFSRAYGNTVMGNLPPAAKAHTLYEYARISAYLAERAEAEKGFIEVLALIKQAQGEADSLRAPTLAEYARMLRDQGDHSKAVPIYDEAVTEMEKRSAETKYPVDFAHFLEDVAENLRAAGLVARADETTARASALMAKNPGAVPAFAVWGTYASAAHALIAKNNWGAARGAMFRAVNEAELLGLSPKTLVTLHYEYGRCLGVTGKFDDAETHLLKALAFDKQLGGPFYMDLTELARLNYDQGKYPEANIYFEQDIQAMDHLGLADDSPAASIDILSEYGVSLRKTGREFEAGAMDARIKTIRQAHPILVSHTDRTPYGRYRQP